MESPVSRDPGRPRVARSKTCPSRKTRRCLPPRSPPVTSSLTPIYPTSTPPASIASSPPTISNPANQRRIPSSSPFTPSGSLAPSDGTMAVSESPSATAVSEVHPDLSGIISPADEQLRLTGSLSSLVSVGVPVHTFTRERVQAMSMNVSQYLKAVRNLTSISDEEVLSLIFEAAVVARIAPLPHRCDEKVIYQISNWVKKGDGARALATRALTEAQDSTKTKKNGFSAVETSFAILLEQQLQDMVANRKKIRSRLEEEILQHQCIIDGLRRRIDTDIRRSDKTYHPGNIYAPLDNAELAAQCWARFIAECQEFQKPVPEWSSLLQPITEEKFVTQIQREHKARFCRGPGVIDDLRKWADSKQLLGGCKLASVVKRMSDNEAAGLSGEEDE